MPKTVKIDKKEALIDDNWWVIYKMLEKILNELRRANG